MYRLFLLVCFLFFQGNSQASFKAETPLYEELFITAQDGVKLRLAFVEANPEADSNKISRNVIVFVPGRTSCFENNYELALRLSGYYFDDSESSLPSRFFDFWSLDNRGHGKSGGRLEIDDGVHDQRCHIDSFETYLQDLNSALSYIKKKYEKREVTYYLMGMSMGGNIVLNYLQDYEEHLDMPFKRAIVISPMVKFLTPGFPELAAKTLSNVATYCGFGEYFIPGHGPCDLRPEAFKTYTGSHNKEDFLAQQEFFKAHPSMLTEGATYGWIKAAFEAVEHLAHMKKSPVPISAFLAGDDRYVDVHAASRLLTTLKAKVFIYGSAYHTLPRESKTYIPGFWKELFEELRKD